MNDEELTVTHRADASRFEATLDGHRSVLDYDRDGDAMRLTHTAVPPALRGRGIAGKLTAAALDFARDNSLKVVPQCSYAAAYLERHPEYQSLVRR